MNRRQEKLAGLLFVLAALCVIGLSIFTRSSLPIPHSAGKLAGEIIFILGMLLFLWPVIYFQKAFQGLVIPVGDHLVRNGPYRWIRHPLYLSMVITLIGIGLALCSLWSLISVFVLFIPAVIYRARLEEQALARKFGATWQAYKNRTIF